MQTNQAGIDLIKKYADVGAADECWIYNKHTFVHSKCRRIKYGQIRYEGKTWRAHRLVAALCVGNLSPETHVCHSCDNPLCLNPAHLFLGSAADNMADKMAKGRHRVISGEQHVNATLSDAQVEEVRRLALEGCNQRLLAEQFNISQPLVSMIKHGKTRAYP